MRHLSEMGDVNYSNIVNILEQIGFRRHVECPEYLARVTELPDARQIVQDWPDGPHGNGLVSKTLQAFHDCKLSLGFRRPAEKLQDDSQIPVGFDE
jgi:hypothetical protein